MSMSLRRPLLLAALATTVALGGCAGNDLDETGGLRITRSTCPAVAIPAYTGEIAIFSPEQSRDLRALDVSATITNLRTTCNSEGETVQVTTTFDVLARRASQSGARQVVLPYFATVMRGGTRIVSKQLGSVALNFTDGSVRAQTNAQASASYAKSMATLPEAVRDRLDRKRKATDPDAALDPMNDPAIRSAVNESSFELLVGFQLTEAQLAYNATR
ncbi:hypothetical protein PQ455_09335 [Sphingomonas naphthae]|uniref:Uncharacterized protein n=1 Tax=Sphingomonas naphthae TaxID=1813468 RepID=A0ABY7TF41_9SPHN|nr:hypothetical protein [Sphingomonas naphthae]WCT71857.1 hypothetical protein PQ455_09335 [Sphingomonas naphthae]